MKVVPIERPAEIFINKIQDYENNFYPKLFRSLNRNLGGTIYSNAAEGIIYIELRNRFPVEARLFDKFINGQ